MRSTFASRGRSVALTVVGIAATAGLLAGCSSDGGSSTGGGSNDEINYALPANATPNWLVPLATAGKMTTHNSSLIHALYEPLVAYDGSTGTVDRVATADIAKDITFADDDASVTITLDDRTWSDGEPITSADVAFWFDLVKANKDVWGSYRAGSMPDLVASVETPDDKTVVLTFDGSYNEEWLLASQLTLITPLPVHAWSITEDGGTPDPELAKTPEGAQAIWEYLIGEGEDLSGYAGNPLFDTISGPYALESFSDSGRMTLEKSDAYDGEDAAPRSRPCAPATSTTDMCRRASSTTRRSTKTSGTTS
jgi:peptide/nickel transport system substrate-binding protein